MSETQMPQWPCPYHPHVQIWSTCVHMAKVHCTSRVWMVISSWPSAYWPTMPILQHPQVMCFAFDAIKANLWLIRVMQTKDILLWCLQLGEVISGTSAVSVWMMYYNLHLPKYVICSYRVQAVSAFGAVVADSALFEGQIRYQMEGLFVNAGQTRCGKEVYFAFRCTCIIDVWWTGLGTRMGTSLGSKLLERIVTLISTLISFLHIISIISIVIISTLTWKLILQTESPKYATVAAQETQVYEHLQAHKNHQEVPRQGAPTHSVETCTWVLLIWIQDILQFHPTGAIYHDM